MKKKFKPPMGMWKVHLPSLLILIVLSLNSDAQWTTNVNDIYNSNTGNVGIGTTAPASKLQVIGESRFGATGNYARLSATGWLSFGGTGFYSVLNNKYAFKQDNSGNRGLFVNKNYNRFEFRDSTSNDLLHVNYYTGDSYIKGKLAIGTTTSVNRLDVEGSAVIGANYAGTNSAPINGLAVETQLGIGTTSLPFQMPVVLGGIDSTEGGQLQLNSPVANFSKAYFMDVHQDDFRILDGTNSGSQNVRFFMDQDGKVGINTTNPNGYLTVVSDSGTIGTYTSSGWAHSSDARLKTNIKPLKHALDKIMLLQGVSYNWKNHPNDKNQIGFIAQEVEKIYPEVIEKDEAGNYSMAIQNLVSPAIEAIKEQQTEIKNKDEVISNMELAVGNLKTKNALLKTRLESAQKDLSQCCKNDITTKESSGNAVGNIAKLEQNNTNSFNEKTIIRCYIPQSASVATLKIYSLSGKEVNTFSINDKGINKLEIAGNTLSPGSYNYLLIVDGKTIDSKQMIITN